MGATHMENRLEEALGVLGPIVIWVFFGGGGGEGEGSRHSYRDSSPRSTASCFCLHASTWFSTAVTHRLGKDEGQS